MAEQDVWNAIVAEYQPQADAVEAAVKAVLGTVSTDESTIARLWRYIREGNIEEHFMWGEIPLPADKVKAKHIFDVIFQADDLYWKPIQEQMDADAIDQEWADIAREQRGED